MMNTTEAFEIVKQIQEDQGEGLLETLQYMDRNLFQFDSEQRAAFRVVMDEFGRLFAPVATPA
jgi:hypothetical protein